MLNELLNEVKLGRLIYAVIEPSPSPSSPGLLSNKRVELEHEPSLDTL
jgi:hypothetical protein